MKRERTVGEILSFLLLVVYELGSDLLVKRVRLNRWFGWFIEPGVENLTNSQKIG